MLHWINQNCEEHGVFLSSTVGMCSYAQAHLQDMVGDWERWSSAL